MKTSFINLIVLCVSVMCFSLVGCSSNTQSENTGVGAVSGAVVGGLAGSLVGAGTGQAVAIGVGAVAGALLGGYVGHSMDSSDNTRVYNTMEHNPTNHATHWKNTTTGNTYTVAPTSQRMAVNGNPNCRRYYSTAVINGEKRKVSGIACRQANGTWQAVSVH